MLIIQEIYLCFKYILSGNMFQKIQQAKFTSLAASVNRAEIAS